SRTPGPFDSEGVASDCGLVAIAFECPGGDYFASGLPNFAEREQVALWLRRNADLFFELAKSRCQWIGSVFVFALGNGPRSEIFFRPERSAGMYEEEFHFLA